MNRVVLKMVMKDGFYIHEFKTGCFQLTKERLPGTDGNNKGR